MSKPAREKVIMWGLESGLLSNYDFHTDFIRVPLDELTDFAERVYTAWIDPNDKTQSSYLPHIGEPVLFCHQGKTYYGLHTGGSFKTGHGVTAKLFPTWDCMWMPLPEPADKQKGGAA